MVQGFNERGEMRSANLGCYQGWVTLNGSQDGSILRDVVSSCDFDLTWSLTWSDGLFGESWNFPQKKMAFGVGELQFTQMNQCQKVSEMTRSLSRSSVARLGSRLRRHG